MSREPITPTTSDNLPRVSAEPIEGSRTTLISPDWTNRTTWIWQSQRQERFPLVQIDEDGYLFAADAYGAVPMVDNFHGKYSNEDLLECEDGYVPRAKVYVDGYLKIEQDPHYGTGGDYVIDYYLGHVTFFEQQMGKSVEMDFWRVQNSMWSIRPDLGKRLKIISVEVQFSTDVSITDTVVFQAWGYVDVFAPHLVGNPYPSGTRIPLRPPTVYKSMMDFINESNGVYPLIPKSSNPNTTWRDLGADIVTYPWNYQAMTVLSSAAGMEIRIWLQHDQPLGGSRATATFYCLSTDE